MSTSISISGIAKSFPALPGAPGTVNGKTIVLHSIDITIEPGELFFLLGPSGCGKTTLLRIIAGFIEPDSGSLRFNDRDVTFAAANTRNTGMVFQSYALWPHMTVAENVAFGLDIRKVPKPEQLSRVKEALDLVRMAHLEMRRPVQLSGGQQQRVALARAIVIRPDVLLLDEPLSNLDAKLRIELRSEIRRICKASGITTVYVTHDQKEALSMADRVAIMHQGRLEQLGTPETLYRRPNTTFVASFLGETNFLSATFVEAKPGLRSYSAAGNHILVSDSTALTNNPKVTLSIRPESLSLSAPSGLGQDAPDVFRLSGTLIDTTYLGEMAQHTVALPDQTRLHVAEFNPGFQVRRAPGAPLTLYGRAADVVALNPETP
jgi:iron(III) transport system ATP-binding protein